MLTLSILISYLCEDEDREDLSDLNSSTYLLYSMF